MYNREYLMRSDLHSLSDPSQSVISTSIQFTDIAYTKIKLKLVYKSKHNVANVDGADLNTNI